MSSGALTYSEGSALGRDDCVSIMILDDDNVECEDVFTVSLSGGSRVAIQGGSEEATVTIQADSNDGKMHSDLLLIINFCLLQLSRLHLNKPVISQQRLVEQCGYVLC